MTLDELTKIADRLTKGIRPNKEEIEELIALAREQLALGRRVDVLERDVARIERRLAVSDKLVVNRA
jgi:hypothetical protein